MATLVPVTTNRIGPHLPLLQLLPEGDQYSWVRGSDGLVGAVHAHDAGVATGPLHGIAHHHVVVLLPDPGA